MSRPDDRADGRGVLADVRPIGAHVDTGLGVYSYHLGRHLARVLPDLTFVHAHGSQTLGTRTALRLRAPDFDLDADEVAIRTLSAAFGFRLVFSTFFPAPASRAVPSVQVVHDVIPLRMPEAYRSSFLHRLYDDHLRRSVAGAARVITVSERTRQDVLEFYGTDPARVVVVRPGGDHLLPPECSRPPVNAPALLDGRPFILSLCAAEARKNLERLIAAYRSVAARASNEVPHLVLAGPASAGQAALRSVASAPGRGRCVILPSPSGAEVAWLLRHARLFVFPSLYEGFGLPVLEAMAAGTPVLCSNTSSLPEVGGDAVAYCNPTCLDDMVESLDGLLADDDRLADLGRRGRARASGFTWHATAAGVGSLLADVLEDAPSRTRMRT